MLNARLIKLKDIQNIDMEGNATGYLTPLEGGVEYDKIPFDIKRVYWITGVPEGTIRGRHSHRNTEQVLVCVSGEIKITVKAPSESMEYTLENPTDCLYLGKMTWRDIEFVSPDAVLLAIASMHFDEDDYIRDYDSYCKEYECD